MAQRKLLASPRGSPERAQLKAEAAELEAVVAAKQAVFEAQASAAALVQGGVRGSVARRDVGGMLGEWEAQEHAARVIQGGMVGHGARGVVSGMEAPPAVCVVELEDARGRLEEAQRALDGAEMGSMEWAQLKVSCGELEGLVEAKAREVEGQRSAVVRLQAGIVGHGARRETCQAHPFQPPTVISNVFCYS